MKVILRKEARELGLLRYYTGKPCVHGHLQERHTSSGCCMECARIKSKAFADARYGIDKEYTDKINERNKIYRQTDKAKSRIRDKVKTDKHRAYRREYLALPHMREKKRAYDKARQATAEYKKSIRDKYRDDKHHRIACILRSRLVACVRKAKIGKGSVSVRDIDIEKLMTRIEFNFKPGMTWDNHGEWHIDHVKPVAAFIAQGRGLSLINALCNLRPEWKSDNMLKSSKFNGVMYRYKSTQSIRNEEDKG